MKKLLLLLLAAIPAFGAYKYVRPVAIPANQVHVSPSDSGSLTSYVTHIVGTFPYLASIANGGSVTSSSGYDIIFASDASCTKLNFERINWNSTTGASEWKVQSTLSGTTDNRFYLCYGNSAITTDQQSTATYDATYKGVWSLGDTNGTGTLHLSDSTSNAGNGTTATVTSGAGQIDGAGIFSGAGGVHIGNTIPLQAPGAGITISAWVAASTLAQSAVSGCCAVIAAQQWSVPNGAPFWSYYLAANDPGCTPNSFSFFWATNGTTLNHVCSDAINSGSNWQPGLWYFVTGTFDGTNGTIYVNGIKTAQAAGTGTIAYSGTGSFNIGSRDDDLQMFQGAIDEVIVSSAVRSDGWIQTIYNNELKPQEFYSIGPPATNSTSITNVSVVPTNTQAVVKFTAPSGTSAASCSVTVSPDPSMSPLVADTDQTIFTGANLANRSGNQITGRTVTAVLGRRFKAYYATAGDTSIRYSRALQASQPHAVDIDCGGEEYEQQFNTATLQLGQAHEDSIPGDAANPGGALWPTWLADARCDVADTGCNWRGDQRRAFWTTDPQTGVYMKPLNMIGDMSFDPITANFWLNHAGSGWTAPSTWTGGGVNATITNSTSKLFAVGMQPSGTGSTAFNAVNTPNYVVPSTLQFNITASIAGGSTVCTTTSTSDDCKIQMCVSLDGVSCAPNAQVYEKVVTNTPTAYVFGSGETNDVLQQPGKRVWSVDETSTRGSFGGLTCAGPVVTITWDGNATETMAGVTINPGSLVIIDSNVYAVASVQASTQFTLTTTPSSCGFLNYNAFSVATWKKTSGATGDTLTLASPSLLSRGTLDLDPQVNSGFISSTSLITLPNGHQAGIVSTNAGQYLVDWVNGDVFPYNSNQAGQIGPPNEAQANPQNGIDAEGRWWYINTANQSIHYVQYVGDYQRSYIRAVNGDKSNIPLWHVFAQTGLQSCSSLPAGASRCINDVTITNGSTGGMFALLHAFDSRYPSGGGNFQQIVFNGVEANDVLNINLVWNGQNIQDYWAWHVVFDPHACDATDVAKDVNGACSTGNQFGPGCIGTAANPVPGCIVGARMNWATPGARWTIDKGSIVNLRANWVIDQSSGTGTANTLANIVGTSFTSVTCPAGVPPLLGTSTPTTSCIQLTLDNLPYYVPTGTVSRAYFNTEPAVGDYAHINSDAPCASWTGGGGCALGTWPLLDIATVTAGTGTQYNLVLACINNNNCPTDSPANTLYFLTNYPTSYPPWSTIGMTNFIWWNWTNNQHGLNAINPDLGQFNGHAATTNGVLTGFANADGVTDAPHYNYRDYRALTDSQYGANVSNPQYLTTSRLLTTGSSLLASTFAGQQGNQGLQIQSHPNSVNAGIVTSTALAIADGNGLGGALDYPPSSKVTNVTGSLYVLDSTWVTGTLQLHQRLLDTQGTSASRIMRNISAPGSVMASDSTGNYTYCYVLLANECRSGSTTGQIYFNVPYYMGLMSVANTSGGSCLGGSFEEATPTSNMWELNDFCVFDAGTFQMDNQAQITGYDNTGWSRRSLGHNLSQGRGGIFKAVQGANLQADSPAPSWLYTQFEYLDGRFATILMKNPSIVPSSNDAARNSFAAVQVNIHVPSGADHAGVEIAYDDYAGFCSPNRAETCIAVGSTVNATTPWYWETSESGSYTPLSCSSTCTVAAPLLWEHVARITPVYFSGSTIVGRGTTQIVPVL